MPGSRGLPGEQEGVPVVARLRQDGQCPRQRPAAERLDLEGAAAASRAASAGRRLGITRWIAPSRGGYAVRVHDERQAEVPWPAAAARPRA